MSQEGNPRFEVEALVENVRGFALVMARRLDDRAFLLRDGSLLQGVAIASADMPRKLDDAGEGRTDLWGFLLKRPTDLGRFRVGQTVELEAAPDGTSVTQT
jgi:hypothetical protein